MTHRLQLQRLWLVALLIWASPSSAQSPVAYRLSFPEPEHRWMLVEASFDDLPAAPLELRMSRSSPGRYAAHDFAKNVIDVRIANRAGAALRVSQPSPHQWTVHDHGGSVRLSYRIFGDRTDGTYLAIDGAHAHINMPAALMWARGLEERPLVIRFAPPRGSGWRVATQLFAGADALTYTAPNLFYLMDSPTELSAHALRTFTEGEAPRSPTFRVAVHHAGTDAEVEAFAADVKKIVGEARHVFGEYPPFEGNAYTFIADYLPWASGDGMEHRNSTILTSPSSLRSNRLGLLDTVSHEFFHAWNVERIRPRSLEPFNLDEVNVSGELWLAEGFTSYYGPLIMVRAGLSQAADLAAVMTDAIDTVLHSPGRVLRSAEEMSRLAPFVDAAAAIDRTNFENTFISYYTWGAAIGLGLELSLRARSGGAVTLDDYMRALWERHGRPGGKAPGMVDRPYTMADLQQTLSSVAGDAAFAADFFGRYIQGREVPDYGRLLDTVGFALRPVASGIASAGRLQLQDSRDGVRVAAPVPYGSPAYAAGLERDDVVVAVAGRPVDSSSAFDRAIRERRPGDEIPVVFERRGSRVSAVLRLVQDPRVEVVPIESGGRPLTAAQRRARDAWLSSRARNSF